MVNNLLIAIEGALKELLILFEEKKIDEEELLHILNEALHHNRFYRTYIFEMLFIEALKINKIPISPVIVSQLFLSVCDEDYLYPDNFGFKVDGTRLKVIEALHLEKTRVAYLQLLKQLDPNQKQLSDPKITFDTFRDCIFEDMGHA